MKSGNEGARSRCALAASAEYIVTRDKDLLSLGAYEGITMITPEEFLQVLRNPTPPRG